jgi:uncharacterized protein YcfJ
MRSTLQQASAIAVALGATLAAQAAHAVEYATVVSSTPVIASVPVSRQQCSEGSQIVQQQPSGAGAVIGAIAGGLLGNTVGGGFGRAAATGIGVVAGSVVGNQVEANGTPAAEVPVRRCQTVTSYENRTVGYDVMYEYAGQRYSTRMARDPGKQFAVNVQPADASSASLPAPAYGGSSANVPAPVYNPPDQAAAPAPSAEPAYYDPLPPRAVYYAPYAPSYYYPAPVVYGAPAVSIGLGYTWGGYRGRHWR